MFITLMRFAFHIKPKYVYIYRRIRYSHSHTYILTFIVHNEVNIEWTNTIDTNMQLEQIYEIRKEWRAKNDIGENLDQK